MRSCYIAAITAYIYGAYDFPLEMGISLLHPCLMVAFQRISHQRTLHLVPWVEAITRGEFISLAVWRRYCKPQAKSFRGRTDIAHCHFCLVRDATIVESGCKLRKRRQWREKCIFSMLVYILEFLVSSVRLSWRSSQGPRARDIWIGS